MQRLISFLDRWMQRRYLRRYLDKHARIVDLEIANPEDSMILLRDEERGRYMDYQTHRAAKEIAEKLLAAGAIKVEEYRPVNARVTVTRYQIKVLV